MISFEADAVLLSARISQSSEDSMRSLKVITSAALVMTVTSAQLAMSQSSPPLEPTEAGKAIFKRANCFGCHKWHGDGGGGYGGAALSLRKTELTRDEIMETVACGRPGTGMPYFARGAYDSSKCYEMSRHDVGDQIPPEGGLYLRGPEIEAVANYVMDNVKGRGEPNYDECTNFFGKTSRVCDSYKKDSPSSGPLQSAEPSK
jgi:mono/diheme cytochrome c family protein